MFLIEALTRSENLWNDPPSIQGRKDIRSRTIHTGKDLNRAHFPFVYFQRIARGAPGSRNAMVCAGAAAGRSALLCVYELSAPPRCACDERPRRMRPPTLLPGCVSKHPQFGTIKCRDIHAVLHVTRAAVLSPELAPVSALATQVALGSVLRPRRSVLEMLHIRMPFGRCDTGAVDGTPVRYAACGSDGHRYLHWIKYPVCSLHAYLTCIDFISDTCLRCALSAVSYDLGLFNAAQACTNIHDGICMSILQGCLTCQL